MKRDIQRFTTSAESSRSVVTIEVTNTGIEIEFSPSSPKTLEDLLMRWIHDLEWPFTTYCRKFTAGFDQWKSAKSNVKLARVLEAFSAYNPSSIAAIQSFQLADPSLWT
ncbi:hypothetical protein M405DRAFT_866380 [Rhizopogon salebrosus TDB-379]|nr:hypothetical protein M405DRAFT_866380 [Rhizopogon salebrosus TDB-379]